MDKKYAHIEIGTIVSGRTQKGIIEFQLNNEKIQMEVDKAREILLMLHAAIEAAISDELIFKFLTTKIGLSEEKAGLALLDFREMRQGSRSTVYPN